ncbi:MAG: WYL domain-containing protein, partial [Chloroflexota bacterium]
MRANRLLSLLFLLQSKEQMTAQELSESLQVSKRTIYRDIEALDLAGVPIYTQDGRNGGIYLDKQYRISLNSLGRDEIQSLFAYSRQGPIKDIGLDDAIENALLKLLAALPLRYREAAERMRQCVHFDTSQWFYARDVSRWMPLLMQAIFETHKVRVRYMRGDATFSERVLAPYGVVAKLDIWYLVALTAEGDMRTFRVSRFQSLEVLDETFERMPSFDLAAHWAESTRQYEATKPRYTLKLRVVPEALGVSRYLSEAYAATVGEPDEQGWTPVELQVGAMQEARM